jgi:Cu/Ag efflux protein CusF
MSQEKTMKIHTASVTGGIIAAGLLSCAAMADQAAQSPAGTSTTPAAAHAAMTNSYEEATATVVGIDAATRDVTLKTADGEIVIINAGDQVRNFAQIKIGDRVTVQYVAALTVDLKKSGTKTSTSGEVDATVRAPAGAKPSGATGRQVTIVATVVAIDAAKQTVTLKGPKGNVETLSIIDPALLKSIKKGDKVEAVYTEALAVSVEAAPK